MKRGGGTRENRRGRRRERRGREEGGVRREEKFGEGKYLDLEFQKIYGVSSSLSL